MSVPLLLTLSLLLAGTALAIILARDLLALTVLMSAYSGVLAVIFALLGAVDVAFTEAVVGAGVSTGLFIALLRRVRPDPDPGAAPARAAPARPKRAGLAVLAAVAVAGVLLHGVHGLPAFGDPAAPGHVHVAAEYVARAKAETHTPNVVTAVLGDYRSFDTLIETAVVVTGAVACLLVLRRSPTARRASETS